MSKNTIYRLNYNDLRNEAHVEFHDTANGVILKHGPSALGIEPQYEIYKPLLDTEMTLLDVIRKSEYTEEIGEQDQVRGNIFRGLSNAVKSGLHHFNEDKQRASQKIITVMGHYGNITTKTFDEETAAVDDLLRELEDSCVSEVALLGLGEWLEQLGIANQKFKTLMADRYAEVAQRPTLRMKDARAAVDKSFRALLNHVEALSLINGLVPYEAFINEMNAVTERYKMLMARSSGRRKKGEESEIKAD